MRKRDKTCAKATPEEPKREQRMVCLMSEEELRIVDMEEDYPTLFGEHDMRR